MANNLASNTMTKVLRGLAKGFEASQVLSKTVNTSLVSGEHDATTGDTIYLKRFAEANAVETAGGDISAQPNTDIVAGRAAAVVQNYITTSATWTNKEEMLQLADLEEYLKPFAQRLVTQFELNLFTFMQKNSGLLIGTPGTPVTKWSDIASANSLMDAMGIPVLTDAYYAMSPYNRQRLAQVQTGLAAGSNSNVDSAWQKAIITNDFGGIKALTSNAMKNYQAGASVLRTGTVSATPTATYVSVKDTMIQTIVLTGLTASTVDAVRAGDLIRITQASRTRINPHTKQIIFDAAGLPIQYTFVVVTGGNTDGAGTVSVTVTAAAINEASGAYNNINTAITSGDTFALLGTANTVYQPNLFYHKNAFAVTTIRPPELKGGVETAYISKGGFTIRATKYANGDTNTQKMRFDLVPVVCVMNPQWSGNAFGE
jgi:hypothetical protein